MISAVMAYLLVIGGSGLAGWCVGCPALEKIRGGLSFVPRIALCDQFVDQLVDFIIDNGDGLRPKPHKA
jgi:hypothetical protein